VTVTPSGEGAVLWRGENGGCGVLVAGTGPPDVVELWDWTLASGDRHSSEAHADGTKELVQVQAGTVVLTVGDQVLTLGTGDAVAFPGDVDHCYDNNDSGPARFCLAVFEPGVGSATRQEANHG
jgi:quercetin dioxygenase-like cupin family protein